MHKLRPHHILDIVRNIGNNKPLIPHAYGHLVHVVTKEILEDPNMQCKLVVENDDICTPCIHLVKNNKCNDILHQLSESVSKQDYNDKLDKRLLEYLHLKTGVVLTLYEYLVLIEKNLDDIVEICTHPDEDEELRKNGMMKGIAKIKHVINGSLPARKI